MALIGKALKSVVLKAPGLYALCDFAIFSGRRKERIGYEKNRYNELYPNVGGAKPD